MKKTHLASPVFLKASSTPIEESKASTIASVNDPSTPSIYTQYNSQESLSSFPSRLNEPLQVYSKAIELDPNSFKARIKLGIILRKQGNIDAAIQAFNEAIRIDPGHLDGHLNLGIALYCQRKLDEAVKSFHTVIKLYPDNFDAYNNLGLALRKQGKLEEAVRTFNKAIKVNPERSTAYNNLGITLKNQGKLNDAINAYNMAIKFSPNDAEAYNNLGLAFRSQCKLKEAVKAYNKAIQVNPKHAGAYNNLGSALYKKGKLEKALTAYNMAIYLDPQFILCYCNRGKVWSHMNKEDKALEDFNKAYELIKNEKLQRTLSGKNKTYIKQVLEQEREDILNRLTRLHRATLDTENIINKIEAKTETVEEDIVKFKELRKTIVTVTDQIIDTIQKKPQESESASEEVALLSNEIKKLQEMNIYLQQQLLEHAQKLEAQNKAINSHEKALKVAGIYDKANILQAMKDLAVDNPELYKYCKTFYWTLVNYFAAYRSLGTNLFKGNVQADQTKTSMLFELGTKKLASAIKDLALGVPFVGGAVALIDDIIDDVFEAIHRKKFVNKVNVINQIIVFNNDPNVILEENISLMCAMTALGVVQSKKDEILRLYSLAVDQEPCDDTYQFIKTKNVKLREMVYPSLRLHGCPATNLGLYDVTLLLAYIAVTYEDVINSKATLYEQFKEVVIKEKWRDLQLKCNIDNPVDNRLSESLFPKLPSDSNKCSMF